MLLYKSLYITVQYCIEILREHLVHLMPHSLTECHCTKCRLELVEEVRRAEGTMLEKGRQEFARTLARTGSRMGVVAGAAAVT